MHGERLAYGVPVARQYVQDARRNAGINCQLGDTKAVSGDFSEGLRITELPEANAGPNFQQAIINGKFHGTIAATTPIGSRVTRPNWS
jgi:hypothetical protein